MLDREEEQTELGMAEPTAPLSDEQLQQLTDWVKECRQRLDEWRSGRLSDYLLKSWHATIHLALGEIGWWRLEMSGTWSTEEEAAARRFTGARLEDISRRLVKDYELIIKPECRLRGIRQNDLLPPPEPKISSYELEQDPDFWTDEDGQPFNPEFAPRDDRYDPQSGSGMGWMGTKWQKHRFRCARCGRVFVGRTTWMDHEETTGHGFDREWWPKMWFQPHYRCPPCGLMMPESYVTRAKRQGQVELSCPWCRADVTIVSLVFHDPNTYGMRICAHCLRLFSVDRFNYPRQGYLCRNCQEQWETSRKNRRRSEKRR